MSSATKWWAAGVLAAGVVLAGCGDDGDGGEEPVDGAATAAAAADATAGNAGGGDIGRMTLANEEVAIDTLRCFFEEQPRAGLGGVFTHSAQGQGTDVAGRQVVLDMTRARAEDGSVVDDISVTIGEPGAEDAVSLGASGPEGLIEFREDSAAATDVESSSFGAEPVILSFDLPCA